MKCPKKRKLIVFLLGICDEFCKNPKAWEFPTDIEKYSKKLVKYIETTENYREHYNIRLNRLKDMKVNKGVW